MATKQSKGGPIMTIGSLKHHAFEAKKYLAENGETLLASLAIGVVARYLYRKISHLDDLRKAGYARADECLIAGYCTPNTFVMLRYDSTVKTSEQIVADTNLLSDIFSRNVTKIRFYRNWLSLLIWPKIVVLKMVPFAENLAFNVVELKKQLKQGEGLIGFESDGTIIKSSIQRDPAWLYVGPTGSGKSNAMCATAASLLLNDNYEVVIVDLRNASAYEAIRAYWTQVINPSTLESLEQLRAIKTNLLEKMIQTSHQLAEHRCKDVTELRAKGIEPVVKPTILILDEAPTYLSLNQKSDKKEVTAVKAELIRLTYEIIKIARTFSVFVAVGNTEASVQSLDLSMSNLKVRIIGQCDLGFSNYSLGSPVGFTNKNLRDGRFYARMSEGIFEIKVPLMSDVRIK